MEHRDFSEYSKRYSHVRMNRIDGIIELTLHSEGRSLVWGDGPHSELGWCFEDVGNDPENRIVIITGTGENFCAELDQSWVGAMTPGKWDRIYRNGCRLLERLLSIGVPVLAAVNGPVRVHAEIAVLSDIVVAAESSYFQDAPHFRHGTVPGDGVHVVWPMLLGPNRGRVFALRGERIAAEDAMNLGVVAEVVPREVVLDRTWEIARELARQPVTTLRYTRAALTRGLRRAVGDGVAYGLALEGLGSYESWPRGD